MDYESIKQLAKDSGRRITDLLALAPKNDPFYAGTPAYTTRGEWFARIYRRAGFGVNRAPHLRRVHYWTVSQSPAILMPDGKPYENTQGCWEFLIEAGKAARYLGLVPMAGITDNKNPNPSINAKYDNTEPGFEIAIPNLADPTIWIDGITNEKAQPYHLEVWCEKSTMNDVLLPVCERYNANLVTFEGEVSITAVCVNLMQRIAESGNKPTRIFYISDFDPAGNSMPVAMSRKLEYAVYESGEYYDVAVKPLALTAELVRQYRLPRIPIKETERRAGKFEAAFGTGAVELDALEAIHPGVLESIVEEALSGFFSDDAYQEVSEQQEELRQMISERVTAITARYKAQIDALKAMQEELRAIKIDVSGYGVERYEPDAYEDDQEWLFRSDRDYEEQIEYYKAHKGAEAV